MTGQRIYQDLVDGHGKVIAITADHHCTQVLVFRRPNPQDRGDYLFSYSFTTGIDDMADRPAVKLLHGVCGGFAGGLAAGGLLLDASDQPVDGPVPME